MSKNINGAKIQDGSIPSSAVVLPNASASTSGLLSTTDWNTFNNKQSTLPQARSGTNGYLLGSDWNTFNNKQDTLPNASASTSGKLTSTDWNTFNNKQNALPTASASTSGILSSSNWSTFNGKQNALPNASASSSGILTSTDWSTFNNKINGVTINGTYGTTFTISGGGGGGTYTAGRGIDITDDVISSKINKETINTYTSNDYYIGYTSSLVFVNSMDGGDCNLYLPNEGTFPNQSVTIKKLGSGTVIVYSQASLAIDGWVGGYPLVFNYEYVSLFFDNSSYKWYIIADNKAD